MVCNSGEISVGEFWRLIINLPNSIFSGNWKEGHVQGIAVDTQRSFVYYSFTTILLKTDLQGSPIASVENIIGHLGCTALILRILRGSV